MRNIIFFLFFITSLCAQEKRAQRYFDKGDYINATIYFEKYLKHHSATKKILLQLSEANYKTFNYRKAKRYTQLLQKGYFVDKDKNYDNQINFNTYHILTALGDFEAAVDFLELYYKNKNIPFNKSQALNEILSLRLKTNDFKIDKSQINLKSANQFGAKQLNDTIYFVSDRKESHFRKTYNWNHKPYLDIFKVKLNNGKIVNSSIESLPESINSKLHEGSFCFSKNGEILYFSRSNIDDDKKVFSDLKVNTVQLFKSINVNGVWSKPIKLSFCKKNFSYQHPALNKKENKLYFSSNENKEEEDYDIFYVEIQDHTQYGALVNLGAKINTPQREHYPFIGENGHLFFSSNGHLGLGMLDVFVSPILKGRFKKPINLGVPINSKFDDFGISYTEKNKGYFASNRKKNDNIYSFNQTGDITSIEYLVSIEVRDKKTKKLIKANVKVTDNSNKIIYQNKIKKFTINTIKGDYILKASAKEYILNTLEFKIDSTYNQKKIIYLAKKEIIPEKIKKEDNPRIKIPKIDSHKIKLLNDIEGPSIIIKNNELYFDMPPIYFRFDKWSLTEESKTVLDGLAEKLDRHKTVYIKISAYTDNRGSDRYNQVLSEKRAESTRNYLALVGYVNARRIDFEGFGESQLLIGCKKCTEKEHQQNRRSEFKIIKY